MHNWFIESMKKHPSAYIAEKFVITAFCLADLMGCAFAEQLA